MKIYDSKNNVTHTIDTKIDPNAKYKDQHPSIILESSDDGFIKISFPSGKVLYLHLFTMGQGVHESITVYDDTEHNPKLSYTLSD